jgi:tetratricopeptide (TPR) repeat protein
MLKKFNKAMDKVEKNFEMNRFAEAITNIEKARALETGNTFTYQNDLNEKVCKAFQKLKKVDEAFTACNATLTLNPKNVEAMIVRSELWQELGTLWGCWV